MRYAAACAILLSVASQAVGAQPDTEIGALKAQIEALTKRVAQLEAEKAAAPAAVPQAQPLPQPAPTFPSQAGTSPSTRVPPATLDRPLQPSGLAIEVGASSGSGQVSIKAATRISHPNLNGGFVGNATDDSIALTASAPVDKNNDSTDLGTLDGFVNSSTLKLRWTRFTAKIANARMNPNALAIESNARQACIGKAQPDGDKIKACNSAVADYQFVKDNIDAATADRYLSMAFPDAPAFAFGIEGTVGYKKFDFLDSETFAKSSSEKVPWGAKAFVSVLPSAALTSVTGALEYQQAYKEQKNATICPPSTGGSVKCDSGALGAPDRDRKLLGSLEFRHLFGLDKSWPIHSFGLSAQFTHDFLDGTSGVDVPVYLVPDEKGNFLGGLRFGYRTDKKGLAVGVFVGSAFTIRP